MSENQKKVWITGASSGIGKATAEKFAKENWKVAISARREEILIEDKKEIELIKTDTTWSFSNNDSLVVKENQVDKIFDRLLKVEKEILITSKEEKWEKFGVDDSLARHITVYDENDKELLHYLFGNSGQDWQHNYIRKHGSSDVYRTNDNVFFLLNTNSTYWGKKPPKPKPTVDPDSTANINPQ